MARSSASLA